LPYGYLAVPLTRAKPRNICPFFPSGFIAYLALLIKTVNLYGYKIYKVYFIRAYFFKKE